MDSLKWEQNSVGLHVYIPSSDGTVAKFTIDKSQINQLHAGTPRIYNVFARFNNQNEDVVFILDLEDLRPVIQKSSGLTITLNKSKHSSVSYLGQAVGRYCLARGESYQDRFLTTSGWKSQRTYYDMFDADSQIQEKNEPSKIINTKVEEQAKEETPQTPPTPPQTKGKLTICPYCGEVYPSSMPVCIYCNNQGKTQKDNDVDLAL
ncbi:MAG: hypothetical protein MJ211_13415 [Bacteroidales bacterium]|nr:hypothetical protein [Bacteroidales bacterium]